MTIQATLKAANEMISFNRSLGADRNPTSPLAYLERACRETSAEITLSNATFTQCEVTMANGIVFPVSFDDQANDWGQGWI